MDKNKRARRSASHGGALVSGWCELTFMLTLFVNEDKYCTHKKKNKTNNRLQEEEETIVIAK